MPLHVTDVRDTATVRAIVTRTPPDVIYHLAAQISVRESVADPQLDAATNVMGTLGVLSAAQEAGARVVLASTGGAMYGDGVVMPTPEAVLPGSHAPYAISKYCAEQYLQLFNRLHGTRHVALRLGNAYGPRQDPHGEAGVVAIFCGQVSPRPGPDDLRRRHADPRLRLRLRHRGRVHRRDRLHRHAGAVQHRDGQGHQRA